MLHLRSSIVCSQADQLVLRTLVIIILLLLILFKILQSIL